MSNKRCYNQYCGLAKALDVIGERWTLLILRDLLLGPWRYSDLMERMNGITTNLLASRLKEMEENGLIKKVQLSSLGSPHVYELSALGKQLEPAMLALSQFGFNFMQNGPEAGDQVDPGRAILNLKGRYRGKIKGLVTLYFNDPVSKKIIAIYQVKFSPASVDIHHGENWQSEVAITLSLKTYADMAFRQMNSRVLEKNDEIKVEGLYQMWTRFLDAFGFNNLE